LTSIEILGRRVDAVDLAGAVDRIAELAISDETSLVVTLGVEMVMHARTDTAFARVLDSAALSLCDTIGLLLASRLRGGPLRVRVTGVDLVDALAERSAQRGDLRFFLLGGAGDTAQRAALELERRYPGVRIAGARNGYFAPGEDAQIVATIRASGANVLLAGLGSPKQEGWIVEYLQEGGCRVGIGIGGTFDVLAGNVDRAPRVFQRAGLEWAYRLAREPRRWRRQLALPRFAIAILGELLWRKSGTSSR
jgi:N-acetylglucosaminyldiphosphoundecaprenol N-acetyl-beta-D-mannosaminyltransferase